MAHPRRRWRKPWPAVWWENDNLVCFRSCHLHPSALLPGMQGGRGSGAWYGALDREDSSRGMSCTTRGVCASAMLCCRCCPLRLWPPTTSLLLLLRWRECRCLLTGSLTDRIFLRFVSACVKSKFSLRTHACDWSQLLFAGAPSPHDCIFHYKGTPGAGCPANLPNCPGLWVRTACIACVRHSRCGRLLWCRLCGAGLTSFSMSKHVCFDRNCLALL